MNALNILLYFGVVAAIAAPSIAGKVNCQKTMTGERGTFKSPNYPHYYQNNRLCEYEITVGRDEFIEINFVNFETENMLGGELTDYVTILDGKAKIRQNVTFYGLLETPFRFRSQTNKVKVIFASNNIFNNYRGFKAKYRSVKKCQPINVQYGNTVCDVNTNGLATYCDVTCGKSHNLVGDSRQICTDDGFLLTASCVWKESYRCNATYMQDYNHVCTFDNATGLFSRCDYSCQKHYVPSGNGTIECVNGIQSEKAKCEVDLDVIEMCMNSSESTECPFTADELDQHIEAFIGDEELEQVNSIARAVGGGSKSFKCRKEMCLISRKTRKYRSCYFYAQIYWRKFPKNLKKHHVRDICIDCQSVKCDPKRPVPIFL